MQHLFVSMFLCLFMTTVYAQQSCIDSLFAIKDSSKLKLYHRQKSDQRDEWRIEIDSMNYSITRRLKKDKTPIYESVTNILTNIKLSVSYHENGRVSEFGYMYTNNYECIGKWYYYSDSGMPERIVDYDTNAGLSFCSFYKLAEAKGLANSGYTNHLERTQIEFDDYHRTWRFVQIIDAPDSVYRNILEVQSDSMIVSVRHDATWIFPVPVTVTVFGLKSGIVQNGKVENLYAIETSPYVIARLLNYDIELRYNIIGYSVKFLRDGKILKDISLKGYLIPKRIIRRIKKLHPGDEVIFYNVKIDEHRHGLYSKFSSVNDVRFEIR